MNKYFLLFALLPFGLFAQHNGDSIRFEMIQATVNFYATDTTTFKVARGKEAKCSNGNYGCLKKFCEEASLKGVNEKIGAWRSMADSSKIEITKIFEKINTDVTSSHKDRAKLPSYAKYEETMHQLSGAFVSSKNQSNTVDSGATTKTDKKPEPEADQEAQPKAHESGETPTSVYIALLLAALALILSAVTLLRGKKGGDHHDSAERHSRMNEKVVELDNRLTQKQRADFKVLEEKLEALRKTIQAGENQPKLSMQQEEKQATQMPAVNVATNGPLIVFAKIPNLENGFSPDILKDNQNGEQIYEIQINGNRATFSISSDTNAQQYAITEYEYYLTPGCDLLNKPQKNTKIITVEKGTLNKSGANWIIQNKARVEFK